jgi:hypothetical protein
MQKALLKGNANLPAMRAEVKIRTCFATLSNKFPGINAASHAVSTALIKSTAGVRMVNAPSCVEEM